MQYIGTNARFEMLSAVAYSIAVQWCLPNIQVCSIAVQCCLPNIQDAIWCYSTNFCLSFVDSTTMLYRQNVVEWSCFQKSSLTGSTDTCPKRCHMFTDCSSCLRSTGGEGGSKECIWSDLLQEVSNWVIFYISHTQILTYLNEL